MATQTSWRLVFLARLAAERSYFLRQLWALDEATITAVPVNNQQTAKDIIAHVAAWDSLTLSRIRLVGNGRTHQIKPLDVGSSLDNFNAELRTRYQDSSLKLALAFALRERSSLCYTFTQLTDEALTRPIHLPWGQETCLRDWFIERVQHDAYHAQELETWRKTLPRPRKRQVGPKLILRAILKAARQEILTLVDMVPDAERNTRPLCGEWTLKDLIGHLADWERLIVDGLRQLLLSQQPTFADPINDFVTFDEARVAARRRQSWPQVWRVFNQTRQALDDALQTFPEPFLGHTLVTPWGKIMPAYFWLTICFGHDHEHALDVYQSLRIEDK